jgi:serine/threonine protein kinase/CRP-like cAMP-binding protein
VSTQNQLKKMDFDNPKTKDTKAQYSMSGWLFRKKGGLFGGWSKSWWVLDFPSQTFSEYRSPASADAAPLAEIDPQTVKKVTKKGKDQLCIIFEGDNKELILKADDEPLRNRWIDVFGEYLLALPEGKEGKAAEPLPTSNVSLSKVASFRTKEPSSPSNGTTTPSPSSVSRQEGSDSRPVSQSVNEVAVEKGRASQRIAPPSSKKDAAIMDTGVFMGKARNFAVSTNKDFQESAKKKGTAPPQKRELDAEGEESNKKRAAVIPVMTPEEQIEESRYVKTKEQSERLLKVVVEQLSNFFGGNLFKEVEPEAIVDLMFQVKVAKNENVVTQGEPTDRMFVIEKGSVGVYSQDFVDRPPELEQVKTIDDIFGVLSLLYNQPGPFTIKAHTECMLWAITRRKFHELTTNQTKRRVARKIRLLEGVPLIADNLDQSILVQLADSMEFKEYESGQEIVKKGEALKKVIIVGDGTAKLMDGDIVKGELQKGDAFGEWALLDIGTKSDSSMVATSTLSILTLEVKEVEELVGPLRAFVLRKWAESRRDNFFFSDQPRGGTVFKPESDIRNPISRLKATVQFGSGAAGSQPNEDDGAQPTTLVQESPTQTAEEILASMNKEQEDQAIAEALQAAKNRGTKADRKTTSKKTIARKTKSEARKTKAASAGGPSTPQGDKVPPPLPEDGPAPEIPIPAAAPTPVAVTPAPVATATLPPSIPGPPSPSKEIAPPPPLDIDESEDEEDEDDDAVEEEENLDKPFDPAPPLRPDLVMASIKLCALLGRGNFGRVHLARNESNHKELFALKVLGRAFIVQNGWESLVENERNAMLELSGLTKSPFLLSMYNSFSDKKNIYLLLELCEGGDLYNLLRITKNNRFNEDVSKFYMACVVMGLEAMQSRELVYRDLKPENLMLSRNGYVKVADFGLAKKTLRTFTVCGTPDYMAPEVILSRGHGMPVDWWAIGVLLFEMVSAITPFFGNEAMDIYENVLAHETVDDLQFPDDVAWSPEAKDLIRQLVHPKKNKRLGIRYPGVAGVKKHPFFRKFDWDSLAKVKMVPPIMPQIVDMSKYTQGNITYDPKLFNVPDDNSGWQLSF